ncbi:MAG: hypothetical protein JNK11_18160 [Alphaproteobacteria bacterium]|nr:hypothetical protein [Alphaproteobacteria bacterium]
MRSGWLPALAVACGIAIGSLGPAGAPAQTAEEGPDSLPEGPGRDETFYVCVTCHSFTLVRQQGMSRGRWEDTLRLMTERHGMPEFDKETRELILAYLSTHYPERMRGRPNPFLKQ